jgi:hypothetical protein
VTNAAIHRVSEVDGRVCLFVYWFTVDRHGLSALAMTRCVKNKCAVSRQHTLCHCEEGEEVTDAAIHRASEVDGRVCLFVFWFTVDRRGLSVLAMTIWGEPAPSR